MGRVADVVFFQFLCMPCIPKTRLPSMTSDISCNDARLGFTTTTVAEARDAIAAASAAAMLCLHMVERTAANPVSQCTFGRACSGCADLLSGCASRRFRTRSRLPATGR